MLAHFVECEQTFFFDGFADGAFGHAIAAAHFGRVGHRHGFAVTFMADVADVGFAEHQFVANVRHAATIAQQLEVITAVDRVAVQAGTNQLVVLDDELFIDTTERVAHDDFFGARVFRAPGGRTHEVAR